MALLYSSFRCIVGSQTFPGWALQRSQGYDFPASDEPSIRICLLENMCWASGVTFFEDPADAVDLPPYLRIGSFGDDFVRIRARISPADRLGR